MAKDFLQIPLQLDMVTAQKPFQKCSLAESVSGMIHLIATSHFGENKPDETFGNELWENDFENIPNIQAFKEKLAQSLQQTIKEHEKRLSEVKVSVGFEQVLTTVFNRRVRQRILIQVEGMLSKTNEKFMHQEVFFMGPLSYY